MPKLNNSKESCFDCQDQAVHAHHVVPRSLGGTKTVFLCADCHGKVHNRNFIDSSALVKNALAKRRKKGFWHGVAPYGYELESGKLKRKPSEYKVLKLIISLDDKGMNNGKIRDELNRRGLAKRNGKVWDTRSVWQTIKKYRHRQREGLEFN
jgi:hypothetical protein